MSHSNSSLSCFVNCMKKYEHNYILHTKPCRPPSPDLTFGTMAHEVLYKAGLLRDASSDGVIEQGDYEQVIPSEVLHHDLKQHFGIDNWANYFTPVVRCVARYEKSLIDKFTDENVSVEREVKLQLTPDELSQFCGILSTEPLVGIVDLLITTPNKAVIIDYKFSSSRKTQDDFDMNSQLYIYALLVHIKYNIPLHNIQVGYIDIPKQSLDSPAVLSNGTLSRSKSQNIPQDLYEAAVIAVHGDDKYYNCKPGGHYYDAWCNMALNKPAYLSIQYLDIDIYCHIIQDIAEIIRTIEVFKNNDLEYMRKIDAYSCKGCEYLTSCKTWLKV